MLPHPSPLPPALRIDELFETRHGYRLCSSSWLPPPGTPLRGAIVFSHGYTDYLGCHWDHRAALLCLQGFPCFGVENRGHGRSEGLSGYFPSIDDVITDFLDWAIHVRDRLVPSLIAPGLPALPVFMLGESLGGAVIIRALQRVDATAFAGSILLAPMIGMDPALRPHWAIATLAKAIAFVAPTSKVPPLPGNISETIISDPQTVKDMATDRFVYSGGLRFGTANQLSKIMTDTEQSPSSFKAPCIIYHGTKDTLTSDTVSLRFLLQADSTDKTFVTVKGSKHMLWWERHSTRTAIYVDMVSWILSRISKGDHESMAAAAVNGVAVVPATRDEEAAMLSAATNGGALSIRPLHQTRISVLSAPTEGLFRDPSDSRTLWNNDNPCTLEPPSAGEKVPTLTEQYVSGPSSKETALSWCCTPAASSGLRKLFGSYRRA